MKLAQRLQGLEREIKLIKEEMRNCHHEFSGQVKYEPYTVPVGYGGHFEGHGSDPEFVYDGFEDRPVSRWSRECIHCGHKEYTETTEPIVTGTRPKF